VGQIKNTRRLKHYLAAREQSKLPELGKPAKRRGRRIFEKNSTKRPDAQFVQENWGKSMKTNDLEKTRRRKTLNVDPCSEQKASIIKGGLPVPSTLKNVNASIVLEKSDGGEYCSTGPEQRHRKIPPTFECGQKKLRSRTNTRRQTHQQTLSKENKNRRACQKA